MKKSILNIMIDMDIHKRFLEFVIFYIVIMMFLIPICVCMTTVLYMVPGVTQESATQAFTKGLAAGSIFSLVVGIIGMAIKGRNSLVNF